MVIFIKYLDNIFRLPLGSTLYRT